MRPINKGAWPTYGAGTKTKRYIFKDWSRAKDHLEKRTGKYCHLCEMRVVNAMAVEHIIPRDHNINYAGKWANFLLICSFCNSHKKARVPVAPYDRNYYWPHLNNTLLAFRINFANANAFVVSSVPGLSPAQASRAKGTIDLYGLDKESNSDGSSDQRLIERMRVFYVATLLLQEYQQGKATVISIVNSAIGNGFFSMWLDIFENEPPVRLALLDAPEFYIEKNIWFDMNLQALPRNPYRADPI